MTNQDEHQAPIEETQQKAPWRRRKTLIATAIAGAVLLGIGGNGIAAAAIVTAVMSSSTATDPTSDGATRDGATSVGASSDPTIVFPDPRRVPGRSTDTTSTTTDATASTAAEQIGVVTILATLNYDNTTQAAGTGMVMTSDGLILTNNHVIDGSTSIQVTVESTGETYEATVVGTDATADVAVLQLAGASGLDTVTFDADETTAVGDDIYSVGNAQGTGYLVTAAGSVTGLDESITVQSEYTGAAESLTNLIELDSDVVSGDSGGPLFDDDGEVIGIVTAASSGTANIVGYAIDIDAALAVVQQIESGTATDTVQLGYPAFLGIQIARASGIGGVPVGGVIAGTGAAQAGLAAGDVITAVDGAAVTTADSLSTIISSHNPGDSVVVTWTDAAGTSHSATITLVDGPA